MYRIALEIKDKIKQKCLFIDDCSRKFNTAWIFSILNLNLHTLNVKIHKSKQIFSDNWVMTETP